MTVKLRFPRGIPWAYFFTADETTLLFPHLELSEMEYWLGVGGDWGSREGRGGGREREGLGRGQMAYERRGGKGRERPGREREQCGWEKKGGKGMWRGRWVIG